MSKKEDMIALIMSQEPNYILFGKHTTNKIIGDYALCSWNERSLKQCSTKQLLNIFESGQIYGSETVGKASFFESKMNKENRAKKGR